MRLIWTTDLHLNHVSTDHFRRWLDETSAADAEGLLITGDVSEADRLTSELNRIVEQTGLPTYFVLGNHDFYGSSIAATRREVIEAVRQQPPLHYLTDLDPLDLGDGTYLAGDDGWGDATRGDYEGTPVRLNDFQRIEEFRRVPASAWKPILQRQGWDSAERLRVKLEQLPDDTRSLLLLTHVPPFREACWYQGHTTDDDWAPFFVCGEMGKMLRDLAASRGDCQITVLCGHTHHAGVAKIMDNLTVYTGAAEYGVPRVEGWVTVEASRVEVRTNG